MMTLDDAILTFVNIQVIIMIFGLLQCITYLNFMTSCMLALIIKWCVTYPYVPNLKFDMCIFFICILWSDTFWITREHGGLSNIM